MDDGTRRCKVKSLPEPLIRHLGASQTITSPVSLVKELIDNAIDARASSIVVEVSQNTLDVIQVRDNGTGIAPDDRKLLARRYCTNKIRDTEDLRCIGGTSLGFRGEALASIAAMSGSMTATTRIEGEEVAVKLTIGKDGQVTK